MTTDEISKVFNDLEMAYPAQWRNLDKTKFRAMVELWQRAFARDSYDVVKMAVDEHISRSKFMPTIAEVREIVRKMQGSQQVRTLRAYDPSGRRYKGFRRMEDGAYEIIPGTFYGNMRLIDELSETELLQLELISVRTTETRKNEIRQRLDAIMWDHEHPEAKQPVQMIVAKEIQYEAVQ